MGHIEVIFIADAEIRFPVHTFRLCALFARRTSWRSV